MSDMEQMGDNMPERNISEPPDEDESRADVYLSAKMMSGMSAGLAFIANVENIAGWHTVSDATLKTAGAAAVGAACSTVAGFLLKNPDS